MLGLLPFAGAQHKARQTGRAAGTGQASLGVCLRYDRIAGRARWTLRTSLGGNVVERNVLEKLLAIHGMLRVRCDQCRFEMTSVDDAENVGPACKATEFMTNHVYIVEAVDRRCFSGHGHI